LSSDYVNEKPPEGGDPPPQANPVMGHYLMRSTTGISNWCIVHGSRRRHISTNDDKEDEIVSSAPCRCEASRFTLDSRDSRIPHRVALRVLSLLTYERVTWQQ